MAIAHGDEMLKAARPEFHRAFMEGELIAPPKGRVKFQETHRCYFYRVGNLLYKIRKNKAGPVNTALMEAYAREALAVGKIWAGEVYRGVIPILRKNDGFALSGEGEPVAYAIEITNLSGGQWLERLITTGKLNPTTVGRVARFLAERHAETPEKAVTTDPGRPEHLRELAEDVFYQVKKYLGPTVNPALPDTVGRPVFKFIEESRKLLHRRLKKGLIVAGHGAFLPEHIYVKGKEILAVSPQFGPPKFRVLDRAFDVGTLVNEFDLAGAPENGALLVKRYVSHAKDRELENVLPFFRTLQAMHAGLLSCEEMSDAENTEDYRKEAAGHAKRYFDLAVRNARDLAK